MPLDPATPFGAIPDLGQPPSGWRLDARCRSGSKVYPLRLLIANHGAGATAPAVLVRMRCGTCGERPRDASWWLIGGFSSGG